MCSIYCLVTLALGLMSIANCVEGKISCFDQIKDLEGNWVSSTNLKYADTAKNLPPSLGRLNLDGTGLWYMEGAGTGKEIKLTSDAKLYTNRAKIVQIYMRYYDKSPRRASLYPLKAPLPLVTLPATSGSDWTEVKYDVDATGPPIEITSYLSSGQFVLFEKIVLAVDSVLPQNPATACVNLKPSSTETGTGRGSSSSSAISSGGSASLTETGSTVIISPNSTTITAGECSSAPPAECKCNCLCNCNKC